MWVGKVMNENAFSKYHPVVNFTFFIGAICFSVIIQHPIYLLAGLLTSSTYYMLLNGKKGWKTIGGLFRLFIFLTCINPLINTRGMTVLFHVFDRPYTLEALLYGVAIASIFVVMMLWLGCYNKIMTNDKFTSLLGNKMPTVSLLLGMVFRMIPNLIKKTKQIIEIRSSIGKWVESKSTLRRKLSVGMIIIGILASWALEESVVTGDSMRARGYGAYKRSSFMIYRMTTTNWLLLAFMFVMIATVGCFGINGSMDATFVPECNIEPINGINVLGFLAYCGYLSIPIVLHIKEAIQWNISRYKI